jgi:ligand-binding sensor domain-containing protein/two-component sensor histidine kinase
MRSSRFLAILLSLSASYAAGQYSAYYTIDRKVGLPSNEIYQSIQDDNGFIYLGTSSGLFRYDGFTFKKIDNKRINGRSVSHLLKTANGRIWCQNFAGQIYRVAGDSLEIVRDYSALDILFPQFTIDQDENVWIALQDKLVKIDASGVETEEPYPADGPLVVSSLTSATNGVYLSDPGLGIFQVRVEDGRFHFRRISPDITGRVMGSTTETGILFFAERYPDRSSRIVEINHDGVEHVQAFKPQELAREIHQVRRYGDDVWVCTSNGAFLFRDSKQSRHLLSDLEISSVMKDREGNYWFTTLTSGVMVVPSLDVYRVESALLQQEGMNFTSLVAANDGVIWMGNLGGDVFKYRPGQAPELLKGINAKNYRRANKLIADNGFLFVARGDNLSIYPPDAREQVYRTSYIRDMAMGENNLYLLTSSGITTFDLDARKIIANEKLSGRLLLVDDRNKRLVVSTSRGTLIRQDEKYTTLLVDGYPVFATAMYQQGDTTWIGTLHDGLYGFLNKELVYRFNTNAGLMGSDIRAIASAGAQVMICTEAGIHKINPGEGIVHFQSASEVDFPGVNAMTVVDGTIYLATRNGLFYLPEGIFDQVRQAPGIAIMTASVNGERYESSEMLDVDSGDDLEFYFKAFSYKNASGVSYKYRTKSTDDWQMLPGSVDRVKFTALLPGKYSFEVKAVYPDGEVSAQSKEAEFRVLAPVWQRGWFIALAILATWCVAGLILWLRVRSVRRTARLNTQLIESQLTALKAQMNPHFMFNALTSIQDLIVRQDTHNSARYLSKFATLLRRILETSDMQSICLDDELEVLQLYLELEKLRFGNDFSYQITVDPPVLPSQIYIPSLIIQPFVENAIKHGLLHKKGEKHLHIHFRMAGDLVCEIVDNGVGRKKSNEIKVRSGYPHQSFATHATAKRISLLQRMSGKNYRVAVEDLENEGSATGTRVVVAIPL